MTLQQLRRATEHPSFRAGVIDMSGTAVGIAAWALVTGVAMVKAGISAPIAIFMSLVVYAGSAQLAVLPLLAAGAPLWVCGSRRHALTCVLSSSQACGAPILRTCRCGTGCALAISVVT